MALDLTTAIAPDLAGRVLASILVSLVSLVSLVNLVNIAMCAGGTVALLAWSRRQPSLWPPRATLSDTVRRLEDKLVGESRASTIRGGACHRARIIAPQPCIRSVQRVPDHDAVMRIGGEAPGRRAHSRKRCQAMACFG